MAQPTLYQFLAYKYSFLLAYDLSFSYLIILLFCTKKNEAKRPTTRDFGHIIAQHSIFADRHLIITANVLTHHSYNKTQK